MQNWKKALTFLRRRLWWLDVIYPVALGLLLFGALSYIVYAGPRQWRLSLQLEKKLLEFGLEEASGQQVRYPGRVLVVSAYPTELGQIGAANAGRSPDASLHAYTQAIESLAASVPLIFIHWDTEAHPVDDPGYVELINMLVRVEAKSKIFFATPPSRVDRLPAGVRLHATWLDDASCDEPNQVQLDCSFVPQYTDWVVQQMLGFVSPKLAVEAAGARWVSDQLWSGFDGYILNLSPPSALSTLSFSQLAADPAKGAGYQVAFIGADLSHAGSGARDHEASDKVATIYDQVHGKTSGSIDATGTPLHVFWAMLAQMFVDRSMIDVPSGEMVMAITLLACVVLLLATIFGGAAVGVALFLVYVVIAPCANVAALRWGHFYVPVFDSYYFGLFVLIVAGLSRLSLLTVERWRLDAQSRLHSRVADLKGNFVSLLSHNLNTPVAKMQGMLALLTKQAAATPWLQQAASAEALATQLEYAIRSVLIGAALEEGVLNETPRTPEAILAELGAVGTGSLRRLGIVLTIKQIVFEEEGQLYLPLTFDVRAVTAAINSMAALFHHEGETVMLDLTLSVKDDELGTEVAVTLTSARGWIAPVAEAILTAAAPRQVRASGGALFVAEVLAALANLTVATYRGQIRLIRDGAGGSVQAVFRSTGHGMNVAE